MITLSNRFSIVGVIGFLGAVAIYYIGEGVNWLYEKFKDGSSGKIIIYQMPMIDRIVMIFSSIRTQRKRLEKFCEECNKCLKNE